MSSRTLFGDIRQLDRVLFMHMGYSWVTHRASLREVFRNKFLGSCSIWLSANILEEKKWQPIKHKLVVCGLTNNVTGPTNCLEFSQHPLFCISGYANTENVFYCLI